MKQSHKNGKRARHTILVSLIGNVLLVFVKLITGLLGSSFALVADAIESLGDVFSSFIIFLGLRVSVKPPDDDHPFGHGKVEPITSFIDAQPHRQPLKCNVRLAKSSTSLMKTTAWRSPVMGG